MGRLHERALERLKRDMAEKRRMQRWTRPLVLCLWAFGVSVGVVVWGLDGPLDEFALPLSLLFGLGLLILVFPWVQRQTIRLLDPGWEEPSAEGESENG